MVSRRAVLAMGASVVLAGCSTASPAAAPSPAATSPVGADPSASDVIPSPTSAPGGPATEVAQGPRSVNAVALTFHGAGDPQLAEQILATAEKAGAVVTVLAVGTWLQAYPQIGRRVLSGGHELGNHTLQHLPMRLMSESAAYDEIVGGQQQVNVFATGPSWFRPSGTPHATPNILAAAARAGYATSLSFDVDPRDYADPDPALVVSRVLAGVQPGSIVSLHLGHPGTVVALPRILQGLSGRGLAAVSVSSLLPGVRP